MKLQSSAFEHGRSIPKIYTCQGKGINPPLDISGVPEGAVSLVLIMDDPDVPKTLRADGMFDHWVVYNIDPQTTFIEEDAPPFALFGLNTSGKVGYFGPCPPDKEHRYFFKLYALDSWLDLQKGASRAEVEAKMQGHIMAKTELMGRYSKFS